jgi:dTDP-4-dehydrorhamnose 3,5-epimerase
MTFTPTTIAGAYIVGLVPRSDERGWFLRTFDQQLFAAIGHERPFVQMNHTLTRLCGALRGLHFQYPPYAESKLVRCIRGCVYDVIVDIRRGSPTFLHWFGLELSPDNHCAMYLPQGCAHGFQALVNDCEMFYCHTAEYNPAHESGLRYDDPRIGIRWPQLVTDISIRDQHHAIIDDNFVGVQV